LESFISADGVTSQESSAEIPATASYRRFGDGAPELGAFYNPFKK